MTKLAYFKDHAPAQLKVMATELPTNFLSPTDTYKHPES